MYDITKPITTAKQVEEFVHTLYFDLNLNANPDEDFFDMVNAETGEPALSVEEAGMLNVRMRECLDLLGEDVYEMCFMQLSLYTNCQLNQNNTAK